MLVKELIKMLKTLDQNATIDMSSDEEGNSYGDIDDGVAQGTRLNGDTGYSLYPENCELPEDRYKF